MLLSIKIPMNHAAQPYSQHSVEEAFRSISVVHNSSSRRAGCFRKSVTYPYGRHAPVYIYGRWFCARKSETRRALDHRCPVEYGSPRNSSPYRPRRQRCIRGFLIQKTGPDAIYASARGIYLVQRVAMMHMGGAQCLIDAGVVSCVRDCRAHHRDVLVLRGVGDRSTKLTLIHHYAKINV